MVIYFLKVEQGLDSIYYQMFSKMFISLGITVHAVCSGILVLLSFLYIFSFNYPLLFKQTQLAIYRVFSLLYLVLEQEYGVA